MSRRRDLHAPPEPLYLYCYRGSSSSPLHHRGLPATIILQATLYQPDIQIHTKRGGGGCKGGGQVESEGQRPRRGGLVLECDIEVPYVGELLRDIGATLKCV